MHIFRFLPCTIHAHTCKQKKHTHTRTQANTRARESTSLLRVLKVCFGGEINPTLLSAPISIILIFHKIMKSRFVGYRSHVNAYLKSPLRGPSESLPILRLKLTLWVFKNVTKSRFADFQITHYIAFLKLHFASFL